MLSFKESFILENTFILSDKDLITKHLIVKKKKKYTLNLYNLLKNLL